MNILVTGGAGFIGTNLIRRLTLEGHKVTSVDNYSTGLRSNHQPDCTYIDGDIAEIKDYSLFGSFDFVFHLAAVARIQPSFEEPDRYFTSNAVGTLNIVKWCSDNDIPLVYAGTSSKHSGKFKNPYTFTKEIGEEVVELFRTHYDLKASVARFYNVYGPYQLTEGGYTTLIGRWMYNIEQDKDCFIYGDGEQRRDFTHVYDVVDGLLKILECQAYGYNFEFGRGSNYSVNSVARLFGVQPIYKDELKGEARNTLYKSNLEKEVLNWTATRNLDEYINDWKSRKN